ncbi:hypothetical protein FPL04_13340 [Xanthomonas arboricola]|nr:hypothetical protein FPL04_13340 [Xanthomonas arboricola]
MLFFDFSIRQTPGCIASRATTDVTTATYGRHGTWVQTGTAYVFTQADCAGIDSTPALLRRGTLLACREETPMRNLQRLRCRCVMHSVALKGSSARCDQISACHPTARSESPAHHLAQDAAPAYRHC